MKLRSSTPSHVYYDLQNSTVVSADTSSYGLGAVLMQLHDRAQDGSFLFKNTEAERRYAQIEKERLAAVWACTMFERYLVGLPEFKMLTDHMPLVPLLNTKDINKHGVKT